jgi:hypothetical protein
LSNVTKNQMKIIEASWVSFCSIIVTTRFMVWDDWSLFFFSKVDEV